eukprot:CAMPEP_0196767316 /NCGR_PEP_ID=MMETSP1095-20130614/38817_1 /TAXON_ID=96789 ORGANISM="Chromulina nebulosa, Strain UTEXLB2642" /NCGR_SAMPLE_ID=MMETSP1095 /ASSEMBLY_ACC=CAM_ASM_000446 /LENGTH=276 /DNA_ID=CAMNT_0042134675 /DNA_START=123 /DNA_END=950 /DNA_ORIENTATION=+
MNGLIPLEHYYVDDTINGSRSHYIFPINRMQLFINGCNKAHDKILKQMKSSKKSFDKLVVYYAKDYWIYLATLKYYNHILVSNDGINNIPEITSHIKSSDKLSAVVFGSQEPWIETWLLHIGISHVTTLEYNYLTYEHPNIKTISGSDVDGTFDYFYNNLNDSYYQSFDIAVSISSFDHDGLGRYGDPINPNGDLIAMENVKKLLKPNGLFFFSVPIGPDVAVWNLHRRYGNKRLPLMLKGWEVVDRFGWEEFRLTQPENFRKTYEPVFVLRQQNS